MSKRKFLKYRENLQHMVIVRCMNVMGLFSINCKLCDLLNSSFVQSLSTGRDEDAEASNIDGGDSQCHFCSLLAV